MYSFDVFDTSLIRKVAAPTDIFRILGGIVARTIGVTNQNEFIEDFVSARILAEQNARLNREETTLDQIWTNLRLLMPEVPSALGPQDELNVERRNLLPNAIVAQQIASLRLKGSKIIFASDTYLPEEFVREQLSRYGLAKEGDGIYVSSTAGVAKWSGGLFKVIVSREGIPPKDIYHHGDDPHSDVAVPKRLGINAVLWSGSKFNTWERAILSKDPECRTAASLLAGSMRAFRLSAAFDSKSSSDQLVATLLGPALMVWAAWVLGAAKCDGISRLYFVSRDTYLLCEAARVLAPHFGDIDCRHLKISRQAISLPATEEISQSGIPWLCRPWEPRRLEFLLLKLGLSWPEVGEHFSSLANSDGRSKRLNTPRDWDEFWNVIKKAPVVDLLRERIANKRSGALAYLRAERLFDGAPAGVVDLGWYAMTQSLLRKLLAIGGSPSIIRGYYLALLSDRLAPRDTGKVTALFYDQAPDHHAISPEYEAFNKRISVLEHLLGLAPHGSVREYKASGSTVEPLYLAESSLHIEFVNKIKNTVKAFCKENHEDVLYYSDNTVARQILNSLFNAWCIQPNRVALTALDHVTVSEGPDNALVAPLLSRWRLIDATKTLIPWRWRDYLRIKLPTPVWPEAAFYISGPFARSVLRVSGLLRRLSGRASANYGPPFGRHK